MFFMGKAMKYSIWGACALFAYHMFLIKKFEKPEDMFVS